MNDLIGELCAKASVARDSIVKVTACGNTTMSHIFAGYSPESLAMAPFEPAYEGELHLTAAEVGLDVDAKADVMILPGIAGHVGGDITAGIDAVRLDKPDHTTEESSVAVYIDIGTNGEIVLSDEGKLYACSTAAGPAFEGGNISCGMRAAAGAIEAIDIEDGKITADTIDGAKAIGICGSGLIDATAKLLDAGEIDTTGRMMDTVYFDAEQTVFLNQKDIRELQLAKSAIRAGIKALLGKAGREEADLTGIIIAGAFGNNINIESALRMGLLPAIDPEKIRLAGNAAAAGTAMALVSAREEKRICCIAEIVEHVELATDPVFQEMFIDYINFA